MLKIRTIRTRSFTTSIPKFNQNKITEDSFATFGKNTASKKDTDTFISVFNKIMTYRKESKENSKGSLQLIFENNLKNNQETLNSEVNNNSNNNNNNKFNYKNLFKQSVLPNGISNNMSISTNTSQNDIRNFPLSVSSSIVKEEDEEIHRNLIEEIQKKQELKDSLKPTLDYLNLIDNDYDLINKVENWIEKFENLTSSKQFQSNLNITDDLLTQIKTKSLETPESPIINQYTLPILVSSFIKTLAIKFDSSMEMISFFQNLKKLNLKSFTFLCTEEIYNEILERSWQKFKNIKMMDSILSDMKANGIIGDLDTISILGLIINDMEQLLDPMNNKFQFFSKQDYDLKKEIEKYRLGLMDVI